MASGEKTEKATPKKRSEARKEGQVAKSKELNSAFTLLFSFLMLSFWFRYMLQEIITFTNKVFINYFQMELSINNFHALLIEIIAFIAKIVAPLLLVAALVGVAVSYLQVGFLYTPKVLVPKFSKLNPLKGAKQMFSKRSLVEMLKSIMKIIIVVSIAYSTIKKVADKFAVLVNSSWASSLNLIGDTAYSLAMKISAVFIILGIVDFMYQKWQHEEDLKMSKEEVKQERENAEGKPEVKSKRRQKQQEMAMSRMMQDIPDASVVITNPTHFAVAIKFDMDEMDVPIVVAKGQDELALRIREVAKENNIEIVEEKPLARALYRIVDIGEEIPLDLYQAVAEVLAYVYQLDQERRS
ncbi:flagellar biosynthetic protein FlhB [Orenia metallireducens]|jgi:flagellar biosynthetic protein FlhB|uniref:Flagellar biosynthetic protein FlhB n=1 Tax=Orenia metallireducens TaxID=1413210 RepID=A0A285FRI5_9FIRM|nr:flagellar biosynthesis protein FlhB [Orenia metallireducens]PRX33658.1 flagellar biosynthetic protein FlhB [Orenia metallireducens]SNY12936.1 flagellar biosynthetic protein FlhB [Orenia metallireducens]